MGIFGAKLCPKLYLQEFYSLQSYFLSLFGIDVM